MRLSRGADQHRWLRVGHHIGEADPSRRSQRPIGETVAALRERRLKRLQPSHAVDQQAVAIDQIEAGAGRRLGNAGFDHGAQQERADAGAGRAGAEHGDALFGKRRASDVDGAETCAPTAMAAVP